MVKNILFISLISAMLLYIPTVSMAQNQKPNVEETQTIGVTINESVIHVINANGNILRVYDLTGVSIAQVKIDSSDKHIELNLQKGCYILKVGKVVRKISIK
jgi:hypothetical protein